MAEVDIFITNAAFFIYKVSNLLVAWGIPSLLDTEMKRKKSGPIFL